jgi:hypothetical protein
MSGGDGKLALTEWILGSMRIRSTDLRFFSCVGARDSGDLFEFAPKRHSHLVDMLIYWASRPKA